MAKQSPATGLKDIIIMRMSEHDLLEIVEIEEQSGLSRWGWAAYYAELQGVNHVNLHEMAKSMRVVLLPGEVLALRVVREGKDKGQGVGYLPDGTMVVVNNGHTAIGQHVEVQVQSLLQTGAGVIVFAEL